MKGPPKFTWTDALHRDEGAHESEGSHRDIGDTAPVAGRMASGIAPALGVDRLMDASARDSTISDVDSTSDAAAAPVGHRTEAGARGVCVVQGVDAHLPTISIMHNHREHCSTIVSVILCSCLCTGVSDV